jgi:IMP cyclohydrolase
VVNPFETLSDYPGRGLVVRWGLEGNLEWLYFVTGRSKSSRDRQARRVGDAVLIEPTNAVESDPLRHYTCARPFVEGLVVGNGDHVDVLVDLLDGGVELGAALVEIDPEPDPPIHTPRIGAVLTKTSATVFAVTQREGVIERRVADVPQRQNLVAVQTTYEGAIQEPAGSAPFHLLTSDLPFDRLTDALWSSLSLDLRVLYLGGTDISVTGCRIEHQRP